MPRRVARRTGAPRHPLRKSRTSSWQSPESQWCVTLLEAGLPRFVEHELSRRSATLPYSCSTVVQPEDFGLLKKETSSLRPGVPPSFFAKPEKRSLRVERPPQIASPDRLQLLGWRHPSVEQGPAMPGQRLRPSHLPPTARPTWPRCPAETIRAPTGTRQRTDARALCFA